MDNITFACDGCKEPNKVTRNYGLCAECEAIMGIGSDSWADMTLEEIAYDRYLDPS